MLLALETATNVCSVVFRDNNGKYFEKRTNKRGVHSEKLFLFIQELMEEQNFTIPDLKAVIVSEGPGSYTGLRIAASAVKGLLFGNDVSLYSANTLASFAQSAFAADGSLSKIHAVIDARRKHLYHQAFLVEREDLHPQKEVAIRPIDEIEQMLRPDEGLAGTGIQRIHEKKLKEVTIFGDAHISARSLIHLFDSNDERLIKKIEAARFEPKYYTGTFTNH